MKKTIHGRKKMKKTLLLALTIFMILFLSTIATAQTSSKPIQLSLFHPVQIFDKETSIKGLCINLIYGVNKDVSGINIGLINKVQGDFLGYQGGLVNLIDGNVNGWQCGCVNIVNGQTVGLQTGWLYNFSKEVSGVQFGLINKTESLYGLQIGLLNFNLIGEPFKFLPIINFSF